MTHPQNQPPVMHGYNPTPPNSDWAPAQAPKKAKPWVLVTAVVAGSVALAAIVGVAVDLSTYTPEEAAGGARQACTEDYVPGKLAAMASADSARFAAVTVTAVDDTYLVKGRVTADRISNDRFDGMANRYRFECSMKRVGDEWVANYSTVLPI